MTPLPNFSETMAKKINTEETPKTEEQTAPVASADAQSEGVDVTAEKDAAEQAPAEIPAEVAESRSDVSKENESIPPQILDLLKKYPAYESLYIDSHGGTYTPNTPAAIRDKAVLYKNPYFNEPKNR